jgi:hypothetical protein
VEDFVIHRTLAYPYRHWPLQLRILSPGVDRTRTLRGAACGTVAAATWALTQPVDKRVFRCDYDDLALLGKAVTGSGAEGWYAIGLAMHLQNGAVFGAVYANIGPSMPLPPALRGPALALLEHLATWPLTALTDRFHPARSEMPRLAGNRHAFWQAAWRHLLFGAVLGELERRLDGGGPPEAPEPEAAYSSTGHGSLEHALPAETA